MIISALCAYYAPEVFSDRYLIEDLFEGLIERGHTVNVYTPTPCRGISTTESKEYRKKKTEVLFDGKLIIHRFSLYKEGSGAIPRAIRYLLLNTKLYFIGIKDRSDIIYAISTPPTQGLMCAFIKKKRKVPFIYGLQDIFPDSLVSTGISNKGSIAWKIGRWIEKKTYQYCDKIVVISEDFRNNLLEKKVPDSLIEIIPNWMDTERVKPVSKDENKLFEELKLDKDIFHVVYAGDLGEAQGIDTLLDVASKFESQKGIDFIIFGDGSRRRQIEERVANMPNVKLFHLLPKERVPEVYSLGDISVVSCKKGLGKAAMPSKTWSIMASGRPILLSFDKNTNLWNLINNEQCGICTEAGNVGSMYNGIISALNMNKEVLSTMGMNGRKYVSDHLSKKTCVSAYCDQFEILLSK